MQFRDVAFSWKETSYVCIRKLGEGGASTVYLMLATSGSFKGKLFAVKFFTKVSRRDWQISFMKEIHFLRGCSHPAIIRVFDEGMYQDKYPFVVMEYMDGSLNDIYKQEKQLPLVEKISFIVQLLSALNYLSRQDPPGVHRDIKPQNILMQGNNWVLSDFGLVFLVHSTQKPDEWDKPDIIPMASNYRTPELVPFARDGTPLPPASDVFQLGLVAAELFTGQNPLMPTGGMKRVELNPLAEVRGPHSATIMALLQDMLIMSTADRITAAAALHRWQELYLTSLRPAANQRRIPAASPPPKPEPSREVSPPPENATDPVIGILAYGSLRNDPGKELQDATASRKGVETPFPVEFARVSGERGGAPTLVRVASGGAKVKAVLFTLKEGVSEAEAKSILWRRESGKIGSSESYAEPTPPTPNSVLAQTITNFEGVNVVVYTDFPDAGKLLSPTGDQLAKLAIASAKNTTIERGQDGISYLMAAKAAGIVTPLIADYELGILIQTQTESLEDSTSRRALDSLENRPQRRRFS